jgi:crotonobetainyl-CoA:carnitine CoA-transferase CaiB-like acyl-CoA transferase
MRLPDGRETLTALLPITLGGHRPPVRLSPPALGEHNRQLLTELGYAQAEIDALSPPA